MIKVSRQRLDKKQIVSRLHGRDLINSSGGRIHCEQRERNWTFPESIGENSPGIRFLSISKESESDTHLQRNASLSKFYLSKNRT